MSRSSLPVWAGPALRITIVVGLVVGAYAVWIRMGYGDFLESIGIDRKQGMYDPRKYKRTEASIVQSFIKRCEQNPAIEWCNLLGNTLSGEKNMNHDGHDMMDMTMRDMSKMLEGQTGDELDKAFIEAMIPHHQGAIEMARYLTGAKHEELRTLGKEIIAAQWKEIQQMLKWKKEWGYDTPTVTPMTPMTETGTMTGSGEHTGHTGI